MIELTIIEFGMVLLAGLLSGILFCLRDLRESAQEARHYRRIALEQSWRCKRLKDRIAGRPEFDTADPAGAENLMKDPS